MIVFILGLVALLVGLIVSRIVDSRSVKLMTKDKLIENCKKLIDKGRVSQVQQTLLHHPKLLLLHFNELQTTLTEYAQSVEEVKNN
ncbi:MAG: hypothetical protein HDQ88_11675 [Clostridia bacterium]|nr:hypothetical protein [Clostridia bacterium]